jgi:hypothetical protein
MVRGKRFGDRRNSLSVDAIDTIVQMTNSNSSRPDIARKIGCCKMTVYLWQKKLDLLKEYN